MFSYQISTENTKLIDIIYLTTKKIYNKACKIKKGGSKLKSAMEMQSQKIGDRHIAYKEVKHWTLILAYNDIGLLDKQ